jgi:hypothetical protein
MAPLNKTLELMPRFALLLFLCLVNAVCQAQREDHVDANTIRLTDIPKNAPRFQDYPAEPIYTGPPAIPDVRTHPTSRMFRMRIHEGAKSGPNFAGHYTIVGWGCGSDCAAYAIVDTRTGQVFHPKNFSTVHHVNIDPELEKPEGTLVKYRLDSKLLIAIGSINEDSKMRGISYFLWEDNRLKRIRFVSRPYVRIANEPNCDPNVGLVDGVCLAAPRIRSGNK